MDSGRTAYLMISGPLQATGAAFRVISLLLLSLGTALFSNIYNQYEASGENLLRNPLFHDNIADWQVQMRDAVSAPDGTLTLSNITKKDIRSISTTQTVAVPPGQRLLFLSCEARALDVVPGEKPWETARVVFFPLTSEGKISRNVPHTLAFLHGTTSWAKFDQIFRVPTEYSSISVVIQLLNASGTLEIRSVSLRSAVENPSYSAWRHILVGTWFIAGLWIAWPLLRAARGMAAQRWILATGGMILVGVLIPASMKYSLTPSWLLPETETQGQSSIDILHAAIPFRFALLPIELDIYKLAHLLLFSLIGYLLISLRPYAVSIKIQIAMTGLFALATESMQVLAFGRSGSLSDVLIDLSGVSCGLLTAAAVGRYCERLRAD